MKGPETDSEKKSVNNSSLIDIFAAFKKKNQDSQDMPMKDPSPIKNDKELEKKNEDLDLDKDADSESEEVSLPSMPSDEEKKQEENKEEKQEENKEENIMYGLTYDEYKKKVNVLGSKLKQCGYCLKFFKNIDKGFITKNLQGDEGEMICYHCLFWVNYSEDLRGTVDGLYEKTIHDYIQECSLYHDQDNCSHKGECFVCDYLNGKRITGIFGEEELFNEKNEPSNTDEFIINITI